jgi:hypothetical protein
MGGLSDLNGRGWGGLVLIRLGRGFYQIDTTDIKLFRTFLFLFGGWESSVASDKM